MPVNVLAAWRASAPLPVFWRPCVPAIVAAMASVPELTVPVSVGVPTDVVSVSVPGPSITRSPLPFEIVPIVRFVSSVVVPVTLKKAVLPEPLATLFPLQFEATLQELVVPAAADHVPLWALAGSCHAMAASMSATATRAAAIPRRETVTRVRCMMSPSNASRFTSRSTKRWNRLVGYGVSQEFLAADGVSGTPLRGLRPAARSMRVRAQRRDHPSTG